MQLQSTLTCPKCSYQAVETMPTDACQFFYECKGCGERLRPLAGDCCVFCSYGSVPCPPIQSNLRSRLPRGPKGEPRPANAMGQYASKPVPAFTKLAVMLRNIPAVRLVFAKFAALLRSNKGRGEPLISEFLDEAPGVTRNAVDQHAAVLKPSSSHEIAAPATNDQSEREKLIRRRWSETGIKMWNPDFHGAGHAALNIQGRSELLPPKPGETLPRYDTLEFKLVRSCVNEQEVNRIVCEDVVVDPPKRRARHLTAGTAMTIIET
jgi:hypothetical protein